MKLEPEETTKEPTTPEESTTTEEPTTYETSLYSVLIPFNVSQNLDPVPRKITLNLPPMSMSKGFGCNI